MPIALGIATRIAGTGRSFRTPGAMVLALAGLTQLVYPYLYNELLSLDPLMLIVLTSRNLLYFVLLGWAIHAMVTAPREATRDAARLAAVSLAARNSEAITLRKCALAGAAARQKAARARSPCGCRSR